MLLVACGQPGGSPRLINGAGGAAPQDVTITSSITPTEFRFEPSALTLRANVPVRLTFYNRLRPNNSGGALAHDFSIDNIGGRSPLSRLGGYRVHIAVAADSEVTGEFQLPRGTYEFYCSVDRHAEDGMIGTVTVRE
jgi:plastocyanin